MRVIHWYVAVAALSCLVPLNSNASWVSDITGVDINVPQGTITFGPPRPDRIPMMLQQLPQDTAMFFLNPVGNALAFEIRRAKEQARKNCVPMPWQVTATLASFFPSDLFPGVCWAVVRNGGTLDSYAIHDGGMAAITLEDVVVFRNSQDGFDPVLWAHELTHVLQYRRLGVEAFAALYTGAWDSMEQEARNFDQFVARSLQVASRKYWRTTNSWQANLQIGQTQYVSYAKQSIEPFKCADFKNGTYPAGSRTANTNKPAYSFVEVINSCPIPIQVVSFTFQNDKAREYRPGPCKSDCTIGARAYKKFSLTDPDLHATSVVFIW